MNFLFALTGLLLSLLGVHVAEDSPFWDCHHMGNHICGQVAK